MKLYTINFDEWEKVNQIHIIMHLKCLQTVTRVRRVKVKPCNSNCFKYSFFVRIVPEWNDVPVNVGEAGNRNLFKKVLKSFLPIS